MADTVSNTGVGMDGSIVGGDVTGRDKNTNTVNVFGPQPRRSELPSRELFFGRTEELAVLSEVLAPESRGWGALIDGPGGIGKTALAIEAGYLADPKQFPTKIFLSAKVRELTPQGEQKLEDFMLPNYLDLLKELALELGETEIAKIPENERANTVRRALEGRKALIIIDNLETFEERERTRVFQFLGRLPASCKAIVTSRRRTDIDARTIRLDRLSPEATQALIANLAERNKRIARASVAERQQLYEITHGNPLLIKWIMGQLERKESQYRTIPDACHFIEAAPKNNDPLEYIFGDLLDTSTESETKVLASLTHFTQPVKVKWIAELAGLLESSAQTASEDLADRALLIASTEIEEFLLPSLAAIFLRNKCPETIAQTADRLTNAIYTLILENGAEKYEGFPILETEWAYIATALPLLIQSGNNRLQKVCRALDSFLNFSGRWDEQLALSLEAERIALAAKDMNNAGWRAYHSGWVYYLRGQTDQVSIYVAHAENHWKDSGTREKARVARLRGLEYKLKKDYKAAIAAYKKALSLERELKLESRFIAITLNNLADAERLVGDYIAAEKDYSRSLHIDRKLNDRGGIAARIGSLAEIALDNQNWLKAEELAGKALSLTESLGRQELIASNCCRLAIALAKQGRKAESSPYAQRAVAIFTKLRSPDLERAQEILRECED